MKKITLGIIAAMLVSSSYAQNTAWSTTNNIGIGTINPATPLDVRFPYSKIDNASIRYSLSLGSNDASNPSVLNFVHTGGASQGLRHWEIQTTEQGVVDAGNLNLQAYGGKVGIGTTSPDRLLTVAGQIGITGNSIGLIFKNIGSSSKLWDITPYGNDLAFSETGLSTPFYIKAGGNIGVGTNNPANKLDVQGGNMSVYNTGSNSAISVGSGAVGKTSISMATSTDANGYGVIQTVSIGGSTFGNTIFNPSGGNILIGKVSQTPGANYKLDINGSARANLIVVNSTGADFVFDHKYILPNLSEVESYINKNHHLPEIPSAEEMKGKGMNVGEINTKLLQKVEELTLYAIEQQKRIADLEQRQADRKMQEERIAALEKALLKLTKNKKQ